MRIDLEPDLADRFEEAWLVERQHMGSGYTKTRLLREILEEYLDERDDLEDSLLGFHEIGSKDLPTCSCFGDIVVETIIRREK